MNPGYSTEVIYIERSYWILKRQTTNHTPSYRRVIHLRMDLKLQHMPMTRTVFDVLEGIMATVRLRGLDGVLAFALSNKLLSACAFCGLLGESDCLAELEKQEPLLLGGVPPLK